MTNMMMMMVIIIIIVIIIIDDINLISLSLSSFKLYQRENSHRDSPSGKRKFSQRSLTSLIIRTYFHNFCIFTNQLKAHFRSLEIFFELSKIVLPFNAWNACGNLCR